GQYVGKTRELQFWFSVQCFSAYSLVFTLPMAAVIGLTRRREFSSLEVFSRGQAYSQAVFCLEAGKTVLMQLWLLGMAISKLPVGLTRWIKKCRRLICGMIMFTFNPH